MTAVNECQNSLGITEGYLAGAGNQCVNAKLDPNNQEMVHSAGEQACSRARMLNASDPQGAETACQQARVQSERAAWIALASAPTGSQPNLNVDVLLPDFDSRFSSHATISGRPTSEQQLSQPNDTSSAATTPPVALPPTQAAAASVAGNALSLPAVRSPDSPNPAMASDAPAAPPDVPMGSIAYLDARNGFRDMRFGDAPTPGMTLIEDGGDTKIYRRASDDLSIGSGRLSFLVYSFYKNRFCEAMLKTRGILDSQALLETFRAAYGPGYQANEFLPEYSWFGVVAGVEYDENSITHDASAVLLSNAISAEEQADKKAAAKRSGANL